MHRYLKRFQLTDESFGEIKNELLPDKLIVENEQLMKLLKEVYYFMGKEIYDTPSKKQKEQSDKFYFIEEPFGFGKFPKMNSFGLAGFITPVSKILVRMGFLFMSLLKNKLIYYNCFRG